MKRRGPPYDTLAKMEESPPDTPDTGVVSGSADLALEPHRLHHHAHRVVKHEPHGPPAPNH